MDDLLEWLQDIYLNDLCNGSWEHTHGFTIENIDNPGWDFSVDLSDTDIEDAPFTDVIVENSEGDWYHCRIRDGIFKGSGGAKNLSDILRIFKEWYLTAAAIADEAKNEEDE